MSKGDKYNVVDLFSGAGGMSYGFHRHPHFRLVAAADAEIGKPSMGKGTLQCNSTYAANMGFSPVATDLSILNPGDLRSTLGLGKEKVNILSVCPPCTGFSRANPQNHMHDDRRNSLVRKAAQFAIALDADIVIMENARELISGNFSSHYQDFVGTLEKAGYLVHGRCHLLSSFGLAQVRERALVIASKQKFPLKTIEDLWLGYELVANATTVRTAFAAISPDASGRDDFPSFSDPKVAGRLDAIPRNGGSWLSLAKRPETEPFLTDAMRRLLSKGKTGSHPDVYGRMAWDKPAPTIKRECSHIGNGRYAHPDANRLCSVREMAMLQGFPNEFRFEGAALSNRYRHIGDAVPPLISYQIAWLCSWMLTSARPELGEVFLPNTHLRKSHLRPISEPTLLHAY